MLKKNADLVEDGTPYVIGGENVSLCCAMHSFMTQEGQCKCISALYGIIVFYSIVCKCKYILCIVYDAPLMMCVCLVCKCILYSMHCIV